MTDLEVLELADIAYEQGRLRGLDVGFVRGAAVAFGMMAMAEAIQGTWSVRACPTCGRAPTAWVGDQCMQCALPRREMPEYTGPHCPVSHSGWCPCEPACEKQCKHRGIRPAVDRPETAIREEKK